MSLPAASGTPSADAPPAPLTEGQKALAQAAESGERVEVVGERSEQTTVFANPDGFSFTLEESSVPVRVEAPDGGWQNPDATLVRRADGSVAPKAAAVSMEFSGGPDDPMARIAEQSQSLELSWPKPLPEPVLDGPSAVYRNVLPDVDLKVTATPESFQHVLVVKTPEAAALPELKKLTFGLKAKGLMVRKGAAGSLAAVDGNGNTVFKAPPAQMWNSAGKQTAPAPTGDATASTGPATQLEATAAAPGDEPLPGDPSETAASGTGTAPGQGDEVARMDVAVDNDSLSVTPDADLLTTTEPDAFPIFIDPTVSWGEAERTLLRSDGYESYGWGNGDDDRGMGAGKCGTWNGYYCGPGYVQRLYFEFSPASLRGKHVLDATFRITEPWAFQCDPRWVDLVRTPDNISSATTWATRPQGGWDTMVDRNVSAGRGSLCDPDSPDAPIEFNDNLPEEPNENLTPTVRDFAAGKFSRLTLMLKAHDESDTSAWKRFKNDATLAVDFVGLPAKPSSIGLVAGSGLKCEPKESAATLISDPTPALTSTPQTASGGESGAQLRVAMDVEKKLSDGTWANAITEIERPSSGYVGDNVKLTASTPTLSEGVLYRYRSWTRSYYNGGNGHLSGPSNASTTGWCHFTIDPEAPREPRVTIESPYIECTSNNCPAAGGTDKPAHFTFGPGEGETSPITHYLYKFTSQSTWSKATGSPATGTLTPARAGTHMLQVIAYDALGRGTETQKEFLVKPGEGPVGRWHFDEPGANKALDAATADGVNDATLGGAAAMDDRGRRGLLTHDVNGEPTGTADHGLTLNGTDAYAQTATPLIETRSPYTLSAWVRLQEDDEYATVLSQQGETVTPFVFFFSGTSKRWYFGVNKGDGSGYYGQPAVNPVQLGTWTHLAGTYDPAKKELHFYVNGKLQGAAVTTAGSWASNGPLQIGRSPAGSSYFPGSIDEVAVWQRALDPSEIADEARLHVSESVAAVELVADWAAESGSGTTVADNNSGYGRSLILANGAAIANGAIAFDGIDDGAIAQGRIVDDLGSFTVSTEVALDNTKLLSKGIGYTGQIVGQRTSDGSAWGFWFEKTDDKVFDEEAFEEKPYSVGRWHFGRLNADGTFSSVKSTEAAAMDAPVRLTGVFNAQDGTISLYLGGVGDGVPKEFTAKVGTGDLHLGRGFTSSAWKHYLPQRIFDVRLWAGAMASETQVSATVSK
ncbi:LamG-like jellyroll fold domain-containing protein [Streptomyces peucetius]|nr:LamG domain protein jellyroll fold domain protein [Streptomyces peucetius subsp. caesius ATCC 27952]